MRYVENEDIIKDRSLDYVDFIREQPCCVTGRQAEPHHLDALGMGANRKNPNIKHYHEIRDFVIMEAQDNCWPTCFTLYGYEGLGPHTHETE